MRSSPSCLLSVALPALLALACGSKTEEDGDPATLGSEDGGGGTRDAGGQKGACNIETGFDGDERCLVAPAPDDGFQLHVGPADYDDADELAKFVMPPTEESTECYYVKTGNPKDAYNIRRQYRMRPGSHHLILKTSDVVQEDGWGECPPGLGSAIGGTQRAISDVPGSEVAPEDVGLGSVIPATTQVAAELHFYNTTESDILRETWVNFYYAEASEVTQLGRGVALIGGLQMAVAPDATENINSTCENTLAGRRIVNFQGHAHAHTTRFSVWKHHGADPRELVYEMYDWAEPASLAYNTVTKNPAPDPASGTAGGHSGLLTLDAGDTLEWECEVHNDSALTLRFANEVHTAEMCNLFGVTLESAISCLR